MATKRDSLLPPVGEEDECQISVDVWTMFVVATRISLYADDL